LFPNHLDDSRIAMPKPWKWISLFVAAVALGAAAVVLIVGDSEAPPEPPAAQTPAVEAPPSAEPKAPPPKPPVAPPDLRGLAESAGQPPPLTPEQLAEDEASEEAQVAAAREWLNNPDPQTRIEGAEQLSAYPTAEAEQLLVQTLTTDQDPGVRTAAADSLEAVEQPKPETVSALVAALDDDSEDVRSSALITLGSILANTEEGSQRQKKIIAELKAKAKSRSVPADTREEIKSLIEDQTN
jgi:hypothetical protein